MAPRRHGISIAAAWHIDRGAMPWRSRRHGISMTAPWHIDRNGMGWRRNDTGCRHGGMGWHRGCSLPYGHEAVVARLLAARHRALRVVVVAEHDLLGEH